MIRNNIKKRSNGFSAVQKMLTQCERGRSMVEMLGVLAVIGVLSATGVYGYTIAMNRYRANELLNQINQRAYSCFTQIETGNDPSVGEFENWADTSFSAAINPTNPTQFQITLSQAPEVDVCKSIKNSASSKFRDINDDCTVFTFNNNMEAEDLENPMHDGQCRDGYTGTRCEEKVDCGENGTWDPDGCECDAGWYGKLCDSDCDGLKDKEGNCKKCPSSGGSTYSIKEFSVDECNKCNGFLNSNATSCYSCSYTGAQTSNNTYCGACRAPNHRIMTGNNCILENCDGFRNSSGSCFPCSDSAEVLASSGECAKCTNREMVGSYCALKCSSGYFHVSNGNCILCSNSSIFPASSDECAKCTNREMVGSYCAPKCSSGYFHDSNGNCRSCSIISMISASSDECAKCTNREMYDDMCVPKCTGGQIRALSGKCVNCSDPDPAVVSACSMCSGTDRFIEGNACVMPNVTRECQWTEWFDVSYPKFEDGGGDFETYERIRAAGGAVCDQPQEIKCEAENYPGLSVDQVGQRVHCDVRFGLVCHNEEQPGIFKMCINYRVSVLCCSEWRFK